MISQKILAGLIAGLVLYSGSFAEARKGPEEPQRDVKYILGLYYGNGENILIRENDGELQLFYRIPGDKCFEQSNMYPLQRNRFDHYTMVEAGPMSRFGEVAVKFERDDDGYGVAVKIGGHNYTRYFFSGEREGGEVFRFKERDDWDALRSEVSKISVPAALTAGAQEPLVNLATIKGLRLKNVYATKNNIFQAPLYTVDKLYLNRSAAAALAKAQAEMAKRGYSLIVWDAYRPWSVSKLASMALPEKEKNMLENPDTDGSPHNTGNAVDVGLYEPSTGVEPEMISGFDEPSLRQYSKFPGGTGYQRYLRDMLREVMLSAGFTGVEHEWWHFEYRANVKYAHLNIPLESLR